MQIHLNGQALQTPCTTLFELLTQQGFDFKTAFACAINQRFVPRTQWPQQALQEGDHIEAITPVTGG
jgi:sulfur carrier protein